MFLLELVPQPSKYSMGARSAISTRTLCSLNASDDGVARNAAGRADTVKIYDCSELSLCVVNVFFFFLFFVMYI